MLLSLSLGEAQIVDVVGRLHHKGVYTSAGANYLTFAWLSLLALLARRLFFLLSPEFAEIFAGQERGGKSHICARRISQDGAHIFGF
jgi:hypothetical protein